MIIQGKEYPDILCCKCKKTFKEYAGSYIESEEVLKLNIRVGDFICNGCILKAIEKEIYEVNNLPKKIECFQKNNTRE